MLRASLSAAVAVLTGGLQIGDGAVVVPFIDAGDTAAVETVRELGIVAVSAVLKSA
jgi:hypothetical protein